MIRVQTEDFDIAAEIAVLRKGQSAAGALVSFTGLVRDMAWGAGANAMTLEHYPGMTERELQRIDTEAHRRWPLLGTTVVHRVGRLLPGENIVLVLTLSAHRQAAFDAAQFLMDYLKTEAPFWKIEETAGGSKAWVEARASDEAAAARWPRS